MLVSELDTPAVTIDLDRLEANIARAQAELDRVGVGNRPHIKTHKIPAIAKMQMAAGAIGITCQKIGEAEVFVADGAADDILITYNIVGDAKTERLMALSKRDRPARRGARQRGGGARPVGGGAPPRRGCALPDRMRYRLGAERRADARRRRCGLAQLAMNLPRMHFEGLMTFPNSFPRTAEYLRPRAEALRGGGDSGAGRLRRRLAGAEDRRQVSR